MCGGCLWHIHSQDAGRLDGRRNEATHIRPFLKWPYFHYVPSLQHSTTPHPAWQQVFKHTSLWGQFTLNTTPKILCLHLKWWGRWGSLLWNQTVDEVTFIAAIYSFIPFQVPPFYVFSGIQYLTNCNPISPGEKMAIIFRFMNINWCNCLIIFWHNTYANRSEKKKPRYT